MWQAMIAVTEAEAAVMAALEELNRAREALRNLVEGDRNST